MSQWMENLTDLPQEGDVVDVMDLYGNIHKEIEYQGLVSSIHDKGRYSGFGELGDSMVYKWRVSNAQ